MAGWKRGRAAAVSMAVVAVAWAVVALAAPAQNPMTPPGLFPGVGPFEPAMPKDEKMPRLELPIEDEKVEPAQHVRPVAGIPSAPGVRATTAVPDPPHPIVRIQVRVPADATPGDDVKYVITVQNVSTADAHAVTVRNPLSPDVDSVVKADPLPEKEDPNDKRQLVWKLGTLKGGASKTIELTLRPKPSATEVKNLAYVKYEHGQAVTTKLAKPTVKVTKTAPKQTVRDESYLVRVLLENTGKVAAEKVRVLENLPASAEVEPVTKGGNRVAQTEGQQWVWEIAKLQPGERKLIEYRVTPRESKDVFTLTSVTGTKVVADKPAEARTQVLVPGLKVTLTGPTSAVNAGESARYEIVVRNTGTLPSANVKITGTIPGGCKPTLKTDGGQLYRDSITWHLPRLEPGEAQSYRFAIKASAGGRYVVVASAVDARGQRSSQELATAFQGAAALAWETKFDPPTVAVGKRGTFTVKVKNGGGELARNVRVQIDVPDAVTVVQTTPSVRVTNGTVPFPADTVPAYGEVAYTLTFEGAKSDQAWFRVRMTADSLGDNPMKTEKMVEVIGNPR